MIPSSKSAIPGKDVIRMPRSILVADDAVFMRRLLRGVLRPAGYVVHEAVGGRDALAAYERLRPDLVVLDLALPDMSGLEVLAALREQDPCARVVVVSAVAAQEGAPEAVRAGATAYLEKPFQPAQLLNKVRSSLSPDAS